MGNLQNLTIGHGLLVKNYKNYLNYPLKSSYGMEFSYNKTNFLNIKVFTSNVDEFFNGKAFAGIHSSLFVSKYFPLKIGFGFVSDMNQFATLDSPYSLASRKINSFEFDTTYDLYNKRGYDINMVTEIAAILFPEPHYYKRYDSSNDLEGALKTKDGTWGAAVGVEGSYSHFFKIKSLIHYNDPLFIPSFFNSTYDFERYRFLSQKDSYSDNIQQIDDMFENYEHGEDLIIIPKDLYLLYADQELVYSSPGLTLESSYNYYDKILTNISYSAFLEIGNPANSNILSSVNVELEILDKVLKNIDKLKFYYSRNNSDNIFNFNNYNENTALGFFIRSRVKFNLLFDFNFERVNYDYNYDGKADNVDILEIGLTYKI